MKYHYIENHRAVATITCGDLSTLSFKTPTFNTKAERREWDADANTKHCYYSLCEGDNPTVRVSADNPVNLIHGFVADYDAPFDWANVDSLMVSKFKDSPPPTWRSRTPSGYIRLVWEFDEPIPVTPAIADAFMKRLSDALRASLLFAGFDRASLKTTQYFSIGEDWVRVAPPLSVVVGQLALFKAANDTPIKSGDTNIPIEDIAAEVAIRFPNKWKSDFIVGARGPLFWIDDGITRDGCQVREDGMLCYSDRAGKGFVSWREILGKKFVSAHEQKKISSVIGSFWFNGKSFYKLLNNTPVTIPKEQLILELRRLGFSAKFSKNQPLSEVEQAILAISNDCRVDEIAPVVFSRQRVVEYNGCRVLNNCKAVPVSAAPDGDEKLWPWLHSFLMPFFAKDDEDRETLPYFLAWFQRLYAAVLNCRLDQGQLLILLGPTGHGKTLLTNAIVAQAVGGLGDASAYLAGDTSFNRDLCGKAAWVVDDQTAASTYADQRKFVELTKRCVANPRIEYHAKYADAVTLPWAGRVMMSLNLDANSLAALPTLDSSNRDKVIALRVGAKTKAKFGTNAETEETIARELPHFLRWLLDWVPPSHVVDSSRFGVATYVDPFIEAAAYDNSSRSAIAEMVEFFAKKVRELMHETHWRGTLTEFQVALHECNGGRSVGNSNNLEFVRRGFTVMEEVSLHNKSVRTIRSRGHGGGKIWDINLSNTYDIDKGDAFS